MAWSKGAVVIVKRGDAAIANTLADAVNDQLVSKKDVADLERDYTYLKLRDRAYWENEITKAEKKYGKKMWIFELADKVSMTYALIYYCVSEAARRIFHVSRQSD